MWRFVGPGAWHFVTLPKLQSGEINLLAEQSKSLWGSIRVTATVGKTSWKTSIFRDKKLDAYLLPVKADVRKMEEIAAGDEITVTLEVEG
jgi:hypothetical protein